MLFVTNSFAGYEVTVINQASSTANGAGPTGIPSLTINVPEGDNRAILIVSHFEREHCSAADDTAAGCYLDSPLLSDNFANIDYADYQTTLVLNGPGGSLNKVNPLLLPAGDLRFLMQTRSYEGSAPNQGIFISKENFHFAIYESEIETLLGGNASGNITLSLSDIKLPSSAGDDASLMAFVFENVNETNTGIVRSGVATAASATTSTPGDFIVSAPSLDAGQALNDPKSGLLVYGYSWSESETFLNMSGFSNVLDFVTSNPNGHFPSNITAYNETDGFSFTTQFRNGPATGSINSFSLQGANPPTYQHDGGAAVSFTIDYARADLSLTKVVTSGAAPMVGDDATFKVTVVNDGPDNTDLVKVLDLLPSGYDYKSSSATQGSYDPITGLWDIGYLAEGATVTMDVIATVLATGDYNNRAEVVESSVFDPDSTPSDGIGDDVSNSSVTPTPATTQPTGGITIVPNAPILSCPNVLINGDFEDTVAGTFWGVNRAGSGTINGWTASGGGSDTYAAINNGGGAVVGNSAYFGNGGVKRVSPALTSGFTFTADGEATNVPGFIQIRDIKHTILLGAAEHGY